MATKLHQDWINAKKGLQKQIDEVKKKGGLNPKQIEDALKSFDGGFGPTLEKCAKAYKDKKEADLKKHAAAAEVIAKRYLETVTKISNERGMAAKINLSVLITRLQEVKDKGLQCPTYFFQ